MRNYARKRRKKAVAKLGGECKHCGMTDIRCLQVDHINGGGTKENRTIGTNGIIRKVNRGESGYQLLCANCNWIKKHEQNESRTRLSPY